MINVAILGFGTVGSGVAEVIHTNSDRISQNAAQEIAVKYIVDVRDFPGSPYENLMIKDFSVVENDPDVQVVVETIGGVGVALEFTRRSLMAGKSVVTSNKELVATHGYELLQIAKEKGVNYLFEASVGGGIPILRPITQCLAANKINEIYGILNGTTNYILTEMIRNGLAFETALAQAQANGYAEANPAADIEGRDACRKICILSALCFGRHVYPEQVPTQGITAVTLDDVKYADKAGYKIKLLGRAVQGEDGKVAAYVAPHLVDNTNLLAGVEGVMNGIVVKGNAIGEVMFYGAGAGKLPTASAVVADVIDAAKHTKARKFISWEQGGDDVISDYALLENKWYVRTDSARDVVSGVFGDVQVIDGTDGKEYAFITGNMDKNKFEAWAEKISVLSSFRVLG
jgi:homoserine dehydrogenase